MDDSNPSSAAEQSAELPDPSPLLPTAPVVVPTHPEIKGEDKENWCTVLEVFGDKIITGWNEGQIKIYNKTDLDCETLLPPTHDGEGKVTCLKCIHNTEIISGYCDGTVGLWNDKILMETFSVAQTEDNSDDEHANCLRWREPNKLVAGTNEGRVCIYNRNADSSFTLERNWDSNVPSVERLEIYEDNVILLPASHLRLGCLYVHSFRGQRLRTISAGPGNLFDMVMHGGHVIAGGNEKVLRIWDVETGTCVKMLEGHEDYITAVDIHDNLVVSGDRSGEIIVWDVKAALEGASGKIKTLPDEYLEGVPRWGIKVGRNFLVRHCPESSKIVVMDLPILSGGE